MSESIKSLFDFFTGNQQLADIIECANIAILEQEQKSTYNYKPIIMSLTNIHEDTVYRNMIPKRYDGSLNRIPVQFVNIDLLFTSYEKDARKYVESIEKLQTIIQFIHQNNSINFTVGKDNFRCSLEMVSLNNSDMHEIWSRLGGKYYPSVLYRCKSVPIISTENEKNLIKEVITR